MSLREALRILLALARETVSLRDSEFHADEDVEAIRVVEGALTALSKIKGIKEEELVRQEEDYTCPKCLKKKVLPSIHGNMCTDCANKERGLSF